MNRFRVLVSSMMVCAVMSIPASAQSVAEKVLRGLADELVPTGVLMTIGSKSATETGVEWRDVVVRMPRVQGRIAVDFIRAIELEDGSVSIAYPETLHGSAAPVKGLPPMALRINGALRHIVRNPGRAQVHTVETDRMEIKFAHTKPAAFFDAVITDYKLTHTEDVGVPLQVNRIRDIPMSGVLELDIKGSQSLLNALVQLGEISQIQMQIAQMMAGSVLQPVPESADHLRAKIVARENGAVLINGDPL